MAAVNQLGGQLGPVEGELPVGQGIVADQGQFTADEQQPPQQPETDEQENLVEGLDEDRLTEISTQCIDEYSADDESRSEWLEKHSRWMRLYHQDDKPVEPMYEWASEESLPIVAEASNQFASRAYKAFFPNSKIIKAVPTGKQSQGDLARADRVSKHLA